MVNGGKGTYTVAKRVKGTKNVVRPSDIGKRGQWGNREQMRYDLRMALGAQV